MLESTPCAVLLRESAQEAWTLLGYSHTFSVGVSMAKFEARQEWALGNEGFETKIITEKDYDAGKLTACIQRFTFATKGRPAPKAEPEPAADELAVPPEGFDDLDL